MSDAMLNAVESGGGEASHLAHRWTTDDQRLIKLLIYRVACPMKFFEPLDCVASQHL